MKLVRQPCLTISVHLRGQSRCGRLRAYGDRARRRARGDRRGRRRTCGGWGRRNRFVQCLNLGARGRHDKTQKHNDYARSHHWDACVLNYAATKETVIVVPCPTVESTSILPPCIWTIR